MSRLALLEPPYADRAGALLARMMPGDVPPIGLFRMFAERVGLTREQAASLVHGGPADQCWRSERERLLILAEGAGPRGRLRRDANRQSRVAEPNQAGSARPHE
ncbi:hypothetical protein AB0B50_22105 [Streptomyces sp. NPDC041068]|uniref:hypothetical protein n=1 Tax=Streptomyces sp. NPDC041068 TaxID=3155130 RepID=UPI0033E3291C